MAGAKSRHYRVAKKEVQMSPVKGVFIPKTRKNYIVGAVLTALILTFIDGVLFGMRLGRNGAK